MTQDDIYDKNDVYEKKIAPLIQNLQLICNMEKMPMFVSVAVKNNKDGTQYRNNVVYASAGITLKEKRIGELLLLLNGFEIDLPDDIKRCMAQLEDYLTTVQPDSRVDVNLTDDKISDMNALTEGGCHLKKTAE